MITIPTITPFGDKVKNICISVSGGADSSILTYHVVKYIKENNLDIKVIPLTVRRAKANHPKAAHRAMARIRELLGDDILLPTVEMQPDVTAKDYEEDKYFNKTWYNIFKDGKAELVMDGTSSIPSTEDLANFKDKSGEVMDFRKFGEERNVVNHVEYNGVKTFSYRPFINETKKYVAELYQVDNLMEELFPFTRSCETLDTMMWETLEHCGECWWCEERQWAFGRLV